MESAFPPSYEEATTKEHWPLVARYIFGSDLCAACLVSKKWHSIFAPFLWGNPAGHFGNENDRVYVALTRFKRALPTASLQVRQLTHTLHLPPALSEIYDGPKAEWLRDVLEQLPNLQSLLVSQLPFFDHSALNALRRSSRFRSTTQEDAFPNFYLRLLIASKCTNATSGGLAEALLHLPKLLFLDLSETTAAKDRSVLSNLRHMPGLQVLKLRAIGLKDEDVTVLANSIKTRIRSLDISNNRLTDASVDTLLQTCIHALQDVHNHHRLVRRDSRTDGDWPAGIPAPYDPFISQLRGNDLDEKFLQRLTKPEAGRIISEDLPATGITHLYISNNNISSDAVARLIATENLHVLDVAGIQTAVAPPSYFGFQRLAPLLERHGKKNLTFLRINHAIVTQPALARDKGPDPFELDARPPPLEELEGSSKQPSELHGTTRPIQELPANPTIFELSAEAATPRLELKKNPLELGTLRQNPAPIVSNDTGKPVFKRDAIFAPEVAGPSRSISLTPERPQPANEEAASNESQAATEERVRQQSIRARIYGLEQRREDLRKDRSSSNRGLLPGALPALSTLVLTEVPPFDSQQGTIITALQKFITDCALEREIADAHASLEFPTFCVPGSRRAHDSKNRSQELFALRQIVLELSSPNSGQSTQRRAPSESSGSPLSPSTPVFRPKINGFNQPERSSTGDPDTEAFWKAQENDFSFFGEEECGLPLRDTSSMRPRRTVEEKMVLVPEEGDAELLSPTRSTAFPMTWSPRTYQAPEYEVRDVVSELARWRREKTQQAERSGRDGTGVAGHWTGEIKIVRPEFSPKKGYVDWYGNYYEKGVYR